ncbi:hypothetical protein AWL63_18195 [Sphingomonas panacis]|uniref:Uncharacterized protein n=1 Tax=Sphingomonas panacis TaxID=1560345 RepID=A0A1B3ZDS3_9SPHN|nr:hypothetical protein [Sphingomonas panacis]AOH85578.1 hypothetical protein AWL63_18195 [Sphingomonas panacis]
MDMTRDQLIDFLIDDTFDTCRQDDGYMRSILREHWTGMSDEEIQRSYHDLAPESSEEPPDDGDAAPKTTILRFRPQAWIRDYAVDTDPDHPDTWEVPVSLLLERFPTRESWHQHGNDRDDIRFEGSAPAWVRDWTGPFEVEILDDTIWQMGDGR